MGFAPLGLKWQKTYLPAAAQSPLNMTPSLVFRDKITKIQYGGIDFGLVLGLNVNLGDFFTIGPEAGAKYALNWGSQNRNVYNGLPSIQSFVPINDNKKETLRLWGLEIYGKVALIFRVGGDIYRGQ